MVRARRLEGQEGAGEPRGSPRGAPAAPTTLGAEPSHCTAAAWPGFVSVNTNSLTHSVAGPGVGPKMLPLPGCLVHLCRCIKNTWSFCRRVLHFPRRVRLREQDFMGL